VIVEIGLVWTLMWLRNFHRVVSKVRESHSIQLIGTASSGWSHLILRSA